MERSSAFTFCEGYYNPNTGIYSNSFLCSKYCCGTCYNRFCCGSKFYRLNHYSCLEECHGYIDEYNTTHAKKKCKLDEVCSGNCNNRYCSFSYGDYLFQNNCSNNIIKK